MDKAMMRDARRTIPNRIEQSRDYHLESRSPYSSVAVTVRHGPA
jgi:hypothetical protein